MTHVYDQSDSFSDLDHKDNKPASIFNKKVPPRILGKPTKMLTS